MDEDIVVKNQYVIVTYDDISLSDLPRNRLDTGHIVCFQNQEHSCIVHQTENPEIHFKIFNLIQLLKVTVEATYVVTLLAVRTDGIAFARFTSHSTCYFPMILLTCVARQTDDIRQTRTLTGNPVASTGRTVGTQKITNTF